MDLFICLTPRPSLKKSRCASLSRFCHWFLFLNNKQNNMRRTQLDSDLLCKSDLQGANRAWAGVDELLFPRASLVVWCGASGQITSQNVVHGQQRAALTQTSTKYNENYNEKHFYGPCTFAFIHFSIFKVKQTPVLKYYIHNLFRLPSDLQRPFQN